LKPLKYDIIPILALLALGISFKKVVVDLTNSAKLEASLK
jgi:hypothetical protein